MTVNIAEKELRQGGLEICVEVSGRSDGYSRSSCCTREGPVRDRPEEVTQHLRNLPVNEEEFYRIRAMQPAP